ncbi:response regulator [Bacillus sp. FJAT-45350]|uniref:response regulator n=1 Tax=Bacillus sp. FJAT-45350 TaxID=2011014 RepID=UPI000BB84DBB|nr:response regulator [Bacillus sp. FJAT-45350]
MQVKDLKVLVCDDSMLIRKKMKDALAKAGCENIQEAENGQIAVDKCKEDAPHIVFMDIVMPDKDGIKALTEIKEFNSKIKVIMASSAGTQSHLKKAIHLGAYDFIQKPIAQNSIDSIIDKILKEGEESRV